MSSERIRIELERDGDAWDARVADGAPELAGRRFPGDGPADVLEQVGQELDLREVERIRSERDL
jgi:hypothetical protein